MKAFIIHGAYGHPEENWFPWLRKRLEEIGWVVYVPSFPTPEGQTLDNWIKVFRNYIKEVDENTVMIGHSLGVPFILHVLERLKKPVRACFLVSGFTNKLGMEEFDSINQSFIGRFDWQIIRENCRHFEIFHSDNDPYVPLDEAYILRDNLHGKLRIIPGAGHFNEKAGYLEFHELLDSILNLQ